MKKVYLVGIGMGNPDTLTLGAQRAVEESQLVIGARRLVDAFPQFEGERLIYPDERIVSGTASELAQQEFLDLAVMLVENDAPLHRRYNAPSFADGDFQRGDAPMTKEEVRELSVCKLHLEPQHTVWDVGAGTGSVSLEMAFAVTEGQVIAIERNEPALELMAQNKERMGACNLRIVAGKAPEALEPLPAPDRVFIGGSGGNLTRIMQVALEKNPHVRFVVTAITLETIGAALQSFKELGLINVEIVQANISRNRKAGPYHLMTAENPVYIMSAEGTSAATDVANANAGAAAGEGASAAC